MKNIIDREQEHESNVEEILRNGSVQMQQTFETHSGEQRNAMDSTTKNKAELSVRLDDFSSRLFQSFTSIQQQNEQLRQLVTEASKVLVKHSEEESHKATVQSDNIAQSLGNSRGIISESMQSSEQVAIDMNSLLDQMKSLIVKNQSNNANIRKVEQNLQSTETQIASDCDGRRTAVGCHRNEMTDKFESIQMVIAGHDEAMTEVTTTANAVIAVSKQEETELFDGLHKMDTNFTAQNNALSEQLQATFTKVGDIAKRKKLDTASGLNILAANLRVEQDRADSERTRFDERTHSLHTVHAEYKQKLHNDIEHCTTRLSTFQKDELQLYKSSGETPSKREYGFPRALSVTSPAAKIIQEFWRNPSPADLNCSAISMEVIF